MSGVIPGWMTYEQWLAGGSRIALTRLGHEVFVREEGPREAPTITVLHGFPTSSHDFAPVLPVLAREHRVLLFDFLGFGDSDKPPGHPYSVLEQADLVQELWALRGVEGGLLLAHDYGVSVAQELLARGFPARGVAWMNGGLYPELHRPTDGQRALAGPDGEALAAMLTPDVLAQGLRGVLAREVPDEVLGELAAAMASRGGLVNLHLLLGYIREREEHGPRWVEALERFDGPSAFVWGMADPVSGAHMLARVRERLPRAPVTMLEDVGHYPQIEAPGEVAPALAAFLAAAS